MDMHLSDFKINSYARHVILLVLLQLQFQRNARRKHTHLVAIRAARYWSLMSKDNQSFPSWHIVFKLDDLMVCEEAHSRWDDLYRRKSRPLCAESAGDYIYTYHYSQPYWIPVTQHACQLIHAQQVHYHMQCLISSSPLLPQLAICRTCTCSVLGTPQVWPCFSWLDTQGMPCQCIGLYTVSLLHSNCIWQTI